MGSQGALARAQGSVAATETGGQVSPLASEPVVWVLVSEGEPRPSGLLSALQIQLGSRARVELRELPAATDEVGREQAVRSQLANEHAELAVWIERDGRASDANVSTVQLLRARRDGSFERTQSTARGMSGTDLDRAIALKASEALDEREREQRVAAPAQLRPAHEHAAVAEQPWRLAPIAQLGAVAAAGTGLGFGQWGPSLAGGVALEREHFRFGALLDLTWLPLVHSAGAGAQLEIQELIPGLGLDAQIALAPLWLGAHAGFALSFVRAEAWNPRGDYGEAIETFASWFTGVEVELPLAASLSLALELNLRVQIRRQRFSIEDQDVADTSRVRPYGRIAVTFRP